MDKAGQRLCSGGTDVEAGGERERPSRKYEGDFPGGAVVRVHLTMQGTRVQALVREDPTCRGATKPVWHNY